MRGTSKRPRHGPDHDTITASAPARAGDVPTPDTRTQTRTWLLLVLLLAFSLRVAGLDAQELRGDEAFGYFFSLRPPAEIVEQTLVLREPHPVASYLLQNAWLDLAGHSEFALRFVSAWFGVLAVALIARLARSLGMGALPTLVAALLLALSPYAIWHSQDARMYSMSLALTLASTWFAVAWLRRVERESSRKGPDHLSLPANEVAPSGKMVRSAVLAVGYVIVSWLALHTHYFAVFVIAAQNLFVVLWLVLQRRPLPVGRIFGRWIGVQLALALLYLPWVLRARAILTGYGGNGDSPGLLAMVRRVLVAFATGEALPAAGVGFGLLAGLLLLMGVWRLANGRAAASADAPSAVRAALLLLLPYLLVPLLATWLSALRRPIFDERYLIAAVPPFYLLIAAALPRHLQGGPLRLLPLSRAGVALFLCGWLVGGMALGLHGYYTDPASSKTVGWRELAAAFHKYSTEMPPQQVRLVENFPDPTLWYYYENGQQGAVAHRVLPPAPHDAAGARRVVDELAESAVQRVVLAVQPAPNWDDSGIAAAALAERYVLAAETTAGSWPVQLYTRPPAELASIRARFQNGLVLDGAAHAPDVLVPGGVLTVHLSWQSEGAALSGGEKVFVHLTGPDGVPVAQTDRALGDAAARLADAAGDSFVTNYGILLPETLPGESYALRVGVYDPSLDGAPRIFTSEGGDFVPLGPIAVSKFDVSK